jgi:DNA-binding beta-propeller fold protein YncE
MKARLGLFCLPLVIGVVVAGCGNNSSSVTVAVSPTSATVLLGTSFRFVATPTGSTNAVQWSVNGVANGNATVGTIDSTGLYTAPATRPVAASAVPVPVIFAVANASVPNSGFTGSVIELQGSSNVANFAPGNTINISGNSQSAWNSSFVIQAVGVLSNGQFGVQIATPAGPPPHGVGGTATAIPNITISAQVTGTSAVANATVTLDSGIRVALSQPTCTIGTNETFTFTAFVSGSSNQTVTWSVSGVGTIDPNSGLYTAPATAGTTTVTATSVADPTEIASATVTIATAADPTVSALSPTTGALGATRQNVYLTGSNFICTTAVLVNGTPLPAGSLSALSTTTFLVVLPDTVLSTPPTSGSTTTLTFTVEREGGSPQPCSTACQLVLSPVRPALVSSSPDSIPSGSTNPVTLHGGYFGTASGAQTGGFTGAPAVSVQFSGTTIPGPLFLSDRQLQFGVPSSFVNVPGLYPITVTDTVSGSTNGSVAAVNLAVQPTTAPAPIGSTSTVPVGIMPSSVAINTATGFAVVANQNSNDITVINLGTPTSPSLTVSTASLCTGSLGSLAGSCVPSAPVSVAVDNLRNLALVANSAGPNPSLAVVNLSGTPTVTALVSFPSVTPGGTAFSLTPRAVAINAVSGRALVAFSANLSGASGSNVGAILDLTQTPPAVINVVNINNGINPHIAVSPKLNWALATPGGQGALSIVDLGRRTISQITGLTCAAGTPSIASATTTSTVSLQVGQPVLVAGVSPAAYNGIFSVTSVSNTQFQYAISACPGAGGAGVAAYSLPVASVATDPNMRGVSINDETQKALFAEPTTNVPAFVFNILDQTSQLVNGLTQPANNVATAMNPLTNIGLIVNSTAGQALVVNPVTPTEVPGSTITGLSSPVDVAIDPASNTALIVNQTGNSVSLFSLGTPPPQQLRSGAPQIVQSSFSLAGPSQSSSRVVINSSLSSAVVPQNQTVTLVGNFPGTPVLRLDGNCAAFTGSPTITNSGRMLTATISGSFLATNGPRLYALDVADACTTPTAPSNVAPLQVIQAVSVVTSACPNPAPQGVAIDVVHNVAVVTEPGCNHVSLVSLVPGTIGQGQFGATDLAVGANPQGVATYPQAGLAVVANNFSNNVSIVDVVNNGVPTTFTSDPLPTGVAIDLGTGRAVVTASGASLADVFPVSTSTTAPTATTIGVQQGPTGVAIDQQNHVAVVANSSSNTASILNLSSNTVSLTSSGISLPQGVAFDPITGLFMVTSAASNQVFALNPNTASTGGIRVGIGPSSIAYNFESGTLVTTNNLSGTVSVVDFIDQTVRGVFSLPSSTQFAIDIHPQTNLAVVADPADNEVLLVPLPH